MSYLKSIFIRIIALSLILISVQCNVTKKEKNIINNSNVSSMTIKDTAQLTKSVNPDSVIKNVNIKKSEITDSKFPVDSMLGIWTVDTSGPHADFELNRDYYFIVDYDGDANRPYTIKADSIKVFFADNITKGLITKARNDSLQIIWDKQEPTTYLRWKK